MAVAALGLATEAGMRSVPALPAPAPALDAPVPPLQASAEPPVVGSSSGPALEREAAPPLETRIRAHVEQLAQQLVEERAEPALVAQTLLDEMSDDELRFALHELTNLDSRDLREIRDVREYSQRLAAIAMSGLVTAPEPESEPVAEVMFSKAVDASGAPVEVADRFDGGAGERIYAHFATDGYEGDRVLVKWFREGGLQSVYDELLGRSPRMLVFRRYAVQRGDAISYVWASRERNWAPGRYRVEFYDPSEPLHKLAAGNFVISKEPPAEPEPQPG